MGLLESILGLFQPKTISPLPDSQDAGIQFNQPKPPPVPMINQYRQPSIDPSMIANGMKKFSSDSVPMATMSGELADAGHGLPDELLPAIISLMESGGGKHMKKNNPFNIGPGIDYPDLRTAIVGGGERNQKGLKGLLREGGPYQKYRTSGKLEDFFNTFTPPGEEHGNPSMEELLQRYNQLKLLFTQGGDITYGKKSI